MKKLIVIAVLAAFLSVVAYLGTADHWWWKVRSARVIYNGVYSPTANVYRSRQGQLLINLESKGESLYKIHYFPQGKKWLVGDTWNFHFLPGVALSENVQAPGVDMGGPKIETEPNLIVQETYLEFTSMKLARVRVEW